MALLDQLKQDMKTAMKAREKDRLKTIRSLMAAIKKVAIDEQKESLSEEEELAFLSKQAKQRRESITAYEEAEREDLVAIEAAELEVIEAYLPKQLSDDEARAEIQAIVEQVGASSKADLGKVMGPAMGKLKGRYPGGKVREIAMDLLD